MDPTPVPDVPNLDWWNQLRKQEQQNAPAKPPPAPNSPQALSSALMGSQDHPYENMHGTGPQGNVANALLNTGSGVLLKAREDLYGQEQPTKEDIASGKVQIPSWQSALPQAVNMGAQAGGAGGPQPAIFGGVTVKTANLGSLALARDMVDNHALPAQIWKSTGWFRGGR